MERGSIEVLQISGFHCISFGGLLTNSEAIFEQLPRTEGLDFHQIASLEQMIAYQQCLLMQCFLL
jgi:hypothetical protein